MLKIGQERRDPAGVSHSYMTGPGDKFVCYVSTGSEVMGQQELKAGFAEGKWDRASCTGQMYQIKPCATQSHLRQWQCQGADRYCSVPYLADPTHPTQTFFLLYGIFAHNSFPHVFLPHAFLDHYRIHSQFFLTLFVKTEEAGLFLWIPIKTWAFQLSFLKSLLCFKVVK